MVGSADELVALLSILPTWVVVGAWVATPATGVLAGVLFSWLADRANRPRLDSLHWTEVARLHHAGTAVVNAQVLAYAGLTAASTWLLATGSLITVDPLPRALVAALCVWLGGRVVNYYRASRVLPWLTWSSFVRGQLVHLLLFLPVPIVALAMMCAGPVRWTDHELAFVLVYGGGVAVVVFLAHGGVIPIGRAVGLIVPADQRLRGIVAEASRRTGHPVRRVWIARTPMANAAALPTVGDLLVTSKALERLDDRQLVAVMLHELGHLREARRDRWPRLVGIGFFVVLGMWRAIHGWLGVAGLFASLLVLFGLSVLGSRAARRLEDEADDHAHEHSEEGEEGLYANALERIHEANLAPAVLRGRGGTHPHLYDRMVKAGVTPQYARPAPPPLLLGRMVGFGVAAVVLFVAQADWIRSHTFAGYDSVDAAHAGIVWSGGDVVPIGALAWHWQESDPARAVTVLRFAAAHSDAAEYPARLACILADRDPIEARRQLQIARRLVQRVEREEAWLRELVDLAESKVKAAEGR